MRRPTAVEAMLLVTITVWALNLTMSRYILTHGVEPLAYSAVRYALASAVFVAIVLVAERSLRVERRHLPGFLAAGLALWLNQTSFAYGLSTTSASVIGLLLGATPIFAALIGVALGLEVLSPRFWVGAALSFLGVGLVAVGTGAELSGDLVGVGWGLLAAATWAVYTVLISPLMRRYSASHISAIVVPVALAGILVVGWPQAASQDWDVGWQVWTLLLAATLGPIVLTNLLFFRVLERIGAARATLAANLQPFVAVVIAVIVLDERMNVVQVLGGALIAAGILAARRRTPVSPAD